MPPPNSAVRNGTGAESESSAPGAMLAATRLCRRNAYTSAGGHAPSEATLAGFNGMTNSQAFLAFATSNTVTQTLAPNVEGYLMQVVTLATGIIGIDPLPADTVSILGQSSTIHAGAAQIAHTA